MKAPAGAAAKMPRGEAMEAAIRSIIPEHRLATVEPYLESSVHALLVDGGNTPRSRRKIQDEEVEKELGIVSLRASQLLQSLNELHPESARRFRPQALEQIRRTVRTLEIIAKAPIEAFLTEPAQKAIRAPNDFPLKQSEQLALTAAHVFVTMTGSGRITVTNEDAGLAGRSVSSPFVDFLTEVFRIRGVTASVEICAKTARKVTRLYLGGN